METATPEFVAKVPTQNITSPTALAVSTSPRSSTEEVQLSATLLKKASRGSYYHRRFMQLMSDNRLRYYKKQGDVRPKRIVKLSELVDCEVSELFVDKWKNKSIYCVNIMWTADQDATTAHDSVLGDDDMISLASVDAPATPQASPKGKVSMKNIINQSPPGSTLRNTSRERKIGGGSVDDESLTFRTGLKRRHRMVGDTGSDVPSEVQIDAQRALVQVQESEKTLRMANISSYEEQKQAEQKFLENEYIAKKKVTKRKAKAKFIQSSKIAVAAGAAIGVSVATAGIGLIAGLAVLGAGAASGVGSAVLATFSDKKEGEIVLASYSYEEMQAWKASLDAALESGRLEQSTWGQLFVSDGRKTQALLLPGGNDTVTSPDASSTRRYKIQRNTTWVPLRGRLASTFESGMQSLRIFKEEIDSPSQFESRHKRHIFTGVSVEGAKCSALKAHTVLGAPALDAFLCTMSNGKNSLDVSFPAIEPGMRSSFDLVERIDDHTDVIHVVFRPLYVFPVWTTARDFVLYRYWRLEPDGSYIICYESTEHEKCPPTADFVRGEMHQVIAIAPLKKRYARRQAKGQKMVTESMITAVVQVDPKGWVPTKGIACFRDSSHVFGVNTLLQLLDIRDAIDIDRFIPTSIDGIEHEHHGHGQDRLRAFDFPELTLARAGSNESLDLPDDHNKGLAEDDRYYDFKFAGRESSILLDAPAGIASTPPPLPVERWAEPDANSFRVRGTSYLTDRRKINAGESIGRLVAVDVVSVDEPILTGMTTHPTERIQIALQREQTLLSRGEPSDLPPFIFVVNIVLPGPPVYHGVFYFAIDDMSTIDGSDGTPSSKLCQQFIFGHSDEFRDKTFKLIPQIVQGNFMVRKAVGSTPAIMGKKLAQYYVRTPRSFELILDCGSKSVAKGVIELSLGYAKTLVVDMGFLFEAKTHNTLPERLFGCVRVKYPEFDPKKLRKVEPPQTQPAP